jgi:DNA-binding MarR family transcriptional regulator
MLTSESVRSGRKANFYITENSFIDNYARDAGPIGIAVYHVLERYMNCETRSTWVGTAKMANILNVSQRTVQRHLKTLEDLKLIRILRTETRTIYIIMPVPPRAKAAPTIPLFDAITEEDVLRIGDASVAWATSMSHDTTPMTPRATSMSRNSDTNDAPYKEEQNLFTKTQEQDSKGNKTLEPPTTETIVARTQKGVLRIVQLLGMPETQANLRIVEAAIKAEIQYAGRSPDDAVSVIAGAAINDRDKGVPINKFWFEDAKWRALNGGRNKAEQQFDRINRARERAIENIRVRSRS